MFECLEDVLQLVDLIFFEGGLVFFAFDGEEVLSEVLDVEELLNEAVYITSGTHVL